MAERLELFVLGGARLAVDGQSWDDLRTRKVLALLVYLAVTRQAQPREVLAHLFWGDRPQEQALTNLRVALSDLRRKLGDFLTISRFEVALRRGANIWVDSLALEELVAGGSRSPADLLQALELYQGSFLDGFHVRDAPEFDTWNMVMAERVREQVLGAYRALGQTYLAQQQLDEGIAICRRWLALDPLAEDGHRLLMRLLAMHGRQAEAVHQYETARRWLADELGVDPDPETEALLAQIIGGQWSGDGDFLAAPRPLPPDLLPFIGRQPELATVNQLLAEANTRLVTIAGPGGIGKTRLALVIAHQQQERAQFAHGVAFVLLAAQRSAAELLPALADSLGLAFAAEGEPLQQLYAFLRLRRLLLVLDNFEQVEGGAAWLSDLLREAPWVKVLVTSRLPLRLQAEQLLELPGLPFALSTAGDITGYPATRLFITVARRTQPDFTLNPADQEALVRICRLVEGMPLALELAAGWTRVMSITAIAAAIEERIDFLQAFVTDTPARHRSIEAVFAATWSGLSLDQKRQAASFSLFRGGGTRRVVQLVLGMEEQELAALIEASVLRYDRQADRYDMHELLRQYAERQLDDVPGTATAVRKRHSAAYCAFLREREALLRGEGQLLALAQIDMDSENIAQAWQEACRARDVESMAGALEALGTFYLWRNRYQEGASAFALAVQELGQQQTMTPDSRLVLARLEVWQAVCNARLLRKQTAVSLLQHSLSLLQEAGPASRETQRAEGMARLQWARLLWQDGSFAASERQFEHAQVLFAAASDPWGLAHVCTGLGDVANSRGHYAQAREWLQKGLSLFMDLGDRRNAAYIQERLSFVKRDQGELIAAEQHSRIALELFEVLGDREHMAGGYVSLGWVLLYLGRFGEALRVLEQGAELYAGLGLQPPFNVLGIVNAELGRYQDAIAFLEKGVMACRLHGDTVEMALGLSALSTIALVESRIEDAELLQAESKALLETGLAQKDRLAAVQAQRGMAARARGRRAHAKADFAEALQISLEIHSIIPLLFALPGVALLLADDGRTDEAWQLYAPLEALPIVANSKLRADLAGHELAERAQEAEVESTVNPTASPWELARIALQLLETLQ